MNVAVGTGWRGASGAQDLGRWGRSLRRHPSASPCLLALPAWAAAPIPTVMVADPGYGDSEDERPVQSMQERCRRLLLLAPFTQAGRVGHWASGMQAGRVGHWECDCCDCSVSARSLEQAQAPGPRLSAGWKPFSLRGGVCRQERCPGCPAREQCRGWGSAVLQHRQPWAALAGASGWRVPEQLSQHGKALASLPMTCRSVVGLFTLGLHGVPAVPPAWAPLPPSQA